MKSLPTTGKINDDIEDALGKNMKAKVWVFREFHKDSKLGAH